MTDSKKLWLVGHYISKEEMEAAGVGSNTLIHGVFSSKEKALAGADRENPDWFIGSLTLDEPMFPGEHKVLPDFGWVDESDV